MKLLKYQSEDADELLVREGNRKVSAQTAYFLNAAMKLNLEFDEEAGGFNMCKAQERNNLKREVTGAIKAYRLDGTSDEDIITKVMKLYNVTKEYVLAILKAQVA